LEAFKNYTSQKACLNEFKHAMAVEKNVVIYDCSSLQATLASEDKKKELMAEWAHVFQNGPGVLVFKGACPDLAPVDAVSKIYEEIIADQRKVGGGGDHFAAGGSNDRIWNSLEKLCVRAPEQFARYYANPWIAAVSEAWLGPGYQVTSQVNVIRPGGKAQAPHRDYHLGFQDMEVVAKFPMHVQQFVSPMLTLQGAVAHVDVPVEAGPTKLLPFSQQYPQGYLAWKKPEFEKYFEDNFVQLPMKKGDMLFFNPALFHAGGENITSGETSVHRMVNLMQVSSPFGRTMEAVNRVRMCKALYPAMLQMRKASPQDRLDIDAEHKAISACAEGYQFPTNLDLDKPLGSNASNTPESQADLFKKSLEDNVPPEEFGRRLDEQANRWQSTL